MKQWKGDFKIRIKRNGDAARFGRMRMRESEVHEVSAGIEQKAIQGVER